MTITDDQGAALAQLLRVTSYTDGGDLLTQAAANASGSRAHGVVRLTTHPLRRSNRHSG